MLEPPDLSTDLIVARLHEAYGLQVEAVAFLPLGADVNTAVYRAHTKADEEYFVKLRSGPFDERSVTVPHFLHERGIPQVMAALPTLAAQLWTSLDAFRLMLYPWVEGRNAFDQPLSEPQWREFGLALRQIHETPLPPVLCQGLATEAYAPDWRERVRRWLVDSAAYRDADPVANQLATFLHQQHAEIERIVERTEQLAQALTGRSLPLVLCHADLHAWNLLVGQDGRLAIVDWDTLILAPKERDLMFIGAGIGGVWHHPREVALFYDGYGTGSVDAVAIAYYRYERIVQDIAAFCNEIFLTPPGGEDRAQSLRYLIGQFDPGEVIDFAHRTYQTLG